MALNLPDSNKTPGDKNHTSDTNLIIDAINALKSEVDNIPAGPQGAQGDPGTPGAAGTPATVTVGSTNTSAAGGNAAVTNSGTASNAVFDFTIPRGSAGPKGDTGSQGPQGPPGEQGPQGPPGGVTPDLVALAGQAALSAANAATSESNAAASEAGVDADRVAAQAAAAAALASEQAADASEAAALASEQAADASEVAAAASAAAALASENAADASESAAASSESNAASSASAASISASAAAGSASSAATSASSISSYASLPVEYRQFGADGSILQNLPTRVHPGEQLLKQAVWWIDSAHSSADQQSVQNLGWGGSALDAQLGSAAGADSNDPKFLAWEGENYVYLPGVGGNRLSVPDEAALDITGDIDIRVHIQLDDWTPSTVAGLVNKRSTSVGQFSYYLRVQASGKLNFAWTTDGSTGAGNFDSTAATGITDGATKWVRVTLDVDNGSSGHDLKFWLSDDGVSWSQLGSTITTAGTTSIYSSSSPVDIGIYWSGANYLGPAGKFYRAIIKDGIDGTTVLDVDTSLVASGSDTSFTARTGQTVTINRSSSGRKSVAVTHPVWSFGTDDYMEVADNDLLDFGASNDGTILVILRQWNTPPTNSRYLMKGGPTTNPYWSLSNGTSGNFAYERRGTTTSTSIQAGVPNTGSLVAFVATFVGDSAHTTYLGQTSGITTNTSSVAVGHSSNSNVLRIGFRDFSTGYADMEFIAAAVFRKALTAGEITTLTNYFQGRVA